MFDQLTPAPPDPILGLTEAFNKDARQDKINLGVGVYQDALGRTPILDCVKQAEQRILQHEASKGYLPIAGLAGYGQQVARLAFGRQHPLLAEQRIVTAQTPGGTGALRIAGDLLHTLFPQTTVWLSEPTWPNHPGVFKAAGVPIKSYSYFDPATNGLDFAGMMETLEKIPAGDVVLLHGCCHNPSGVDPTPEQWTQVADVVERRELVPLVDFAYQGFGDGIERDAAGLLELARRDLEMFVCSSYSKNFGLYGERTGALSIVGRSAAEASAAFSHVKQAVRANYSNPPLHGAAIVQTVLEDDELRSLWQQELAVMRERINTMRRLFVDTLTAQLAAIGKTGTDFSFIAQQRGMFSFSGLTRPEVDRLREEYGIYIVGSGRINVAGMAEATMSRLCEAIAAVIGSRS